jgi:hypothetical protein
VSGEIVGTSVVAASGEVDRGDVVRRAAAEACAAASRRIERRGDVLDDDRAAAFWASVAISMELSGRLVPVDETAWYLDPADPLKLLAPSINPGLDGLAVRRGETTAVVMPSRMLIEGLPARGALSVAMGVFDDDRLSVATASPQTIRDGGYTVLRFRTVHMAQFDEGEPPRFLSRGGRIVERTALTRPAAIADLGVRMIEHLVGRRWPGIEPLGLMGDYQPVTGLHRPLIANRLEQSLAAAALLRASKSPSLPEATRTLARSVGVELLRELAVVEEEREEPLGDDPLAAAMTVWAMSMVPAGGSNDAMVALRGASRQTLANAYNTGSGFDPSVPETGLGLLALGLTSTDTPPAVADAAIREVFGRVGIGSLVGQMPYLFFAERDLAKRRKLDGPLPSAPALLEMRAQVLEQGMLGRGDLDAEDYDLAGGIVFTRARSPLPSSQSLRPIAALAGMMRDPWLTEPSSPEWARLLLKQLELTRFVAQLTASEAEGHMYADADKALGGVRASLWDQTMPTEATALGLISVCETLDAVAGNPGR